MNMVNLANKLLNPFNVKPTMTISEYEKHLRTLNNEELEQEYMDRFDDSDQMNNQWEQYGRDFIETYLVTHWAFDHLSE